MTRKHVWHVLLRKKILRREDFFTPDKGQAQRIVSHYRACGYEATVNRVSVAWARVEASFDPFGLRPFTLLSPRTVLVSKTMRRKVLRHLRKVDR